MLTGMSPPTTTFQRLRRGVVAVLLAVLSPVAGLVCSWALFAGTDVSYGNEVGYDLPCGTTVWVALGPGGFGPGGEVQDQEYRDAICRAAARERALWWGLPSGVLTVAGLVGLAWSTRGIAAPGAVIGSVHSGT